MSLPSINFLHLTVSEIQPGQTLFPPPAHPPARPPARPPGRPPAHPDTMGENNTWGKNHSISHGFRDIHNFSFSAKNSRWPIKAAKIENFPPGTEYSCTSLWVKNLLEIVLSLTISEIFSMFYFPLKSKMAAKSGEN